MWWVDPGWQLSPHPAGQYRRESEKQKQENLIGEDKGRLIQ